MEEAKVIGKKLKHLRIDYELTQEELAQKIKCNKRSISTWECGTTWIPIKYLLRVAKIFNVKLDYFYSQNEEASNVQPTKLSLQE